MNNSIVVNVEQIEAISKLDCSSFQIEDTNLATTVGVIGLDNDSIPTGQKWLVDEYGCVMVIGTK